MDDSEQLPDAAQVMAARLAERYIINRELGRGGMATVYLAHDPRQGRRVALKVLRPELATAIGSERFLREIRLTAQLDHPHIVPVLDSGDAQGLLWYAMPYVDGESLRARLLREVSLSVDEAIRLTGEIAEALEYARRRGIVHRDVKPENILLSGDHVRVSDFGIAKAVGVAQTGGHRSGPTSPLTRLTETGMIIGTPAYMSPEQATGGVVDARSDVYSLGCVLFEMLTGTVPYTGPTGPAMLVKRFTEPVPSVRKLQPSVPEHVELAIQRALAPAPDDRFATAADFHTRLTAGPVALTAVVSAGAPGARNPTRLARGALVAVATIALAGIGIVFGRMPRGSQAAGTPRVAVVPFENRTGDAALAPLGQMAADWIGRGLLQTGVVEVLAPVADGTAADMVVTGGYHRLGDTLVLQGAVSEGGSTKVLHALTPVRGLVARPTEALDAIRDQAMATLAAIADQRFRAAAPGSRPADFAAYRAYARALELEQSGGPAEAVLDGYKEAATLDTAFFTATMDFGRVALELGRCTLADSVGRELRRRWDRLTPLERLGANLQEGACDSRDPEQLYRDGRSLLSHGLPRVNYLFAVWSAMGAGHPREAASVLAELDPSRDLGWLAPHAYWAELARAHRLAGDPATALEVLERGRRISSTESELRPEVIATLAALGREADLVAATDAAPALGGYLRGAAGLRAAGQNDASRRLAERGLAWWTGASRTPDARTAQLEAELRLLAGRPAEALLAFARLARADSADADALGMWSVAATLAGDTAAAREAAARLTRGAATSAQGRAATARARIAAVLGDSAAAVASLREAVRYVGRWQIIAEDWVLRDWLRGYPPFELLVQPKE